jgi:hypothetical protein
MIDRDHDLPLTRQAKLLKLSRSGFVLPSSAGGAGRFGDHASDRRVAPRIPIRGQPDALLRSVAAKLTLIRSM